MIDRESTTPAPLCVAVLGAGSMGAAIASQFARAGHTVRITTSSRRSAAKALSQIGYDAAWCASVPSAVDGTALVIEALPEVLELKQVQLAEAQAASPTAVLGTNTSSFQISEVGKGLMDASRLVGMHFINPPSAFAVVELVTADVSSSSAVSQAAAILEGIGKRPIRVRDVPGFVFNRLQFSLLREALDLIDAGVITADDLDELVSETLGRRLAAVGPVATVELGGADLFQSIAERLYPDLSRRIAPTSMRRLHLTSRELSEMHALRAQRLGIGPDTGKRQS